VWIALAAFYARDRALGDAHGLANVGLGQLLSPAKQDELVEHLLVSVNQFVRVALLGIVKVDPQHLI